MTHQVSWFEVIGKDGRSLTAFYGDLFGRKLEAVANDYCMAPPRRMASGGARSRPVGCDGHVTFNAVTDVLQASL